MDQGPGAGNQACGGRKAGVAFLAQECCGADLGISTGGRSGTSGEMVSLRPPLAGSSSPAVSDTCGGFSQNICKEDGGAAVLGARWLN
jgi:ribosomal protein S27E